MSDPTQQHPPSASYSELGTPLELPCGAILKNRIVKAAMSDGLGNGDGNPTDAQARLYERWAEGGTALSIVGEVQGVPHYPEKPGNLVLGPTSDLNAVKSFVSRSIIDGTHLWPQLGHAGALSHAPISRPKGPSPLNVPGLQCAGMSAEEVEALPGMYARTAVLSKALGFTGVHIHAGHGFLLSQFLSPLFNMRLDEYGGPIEARSRIVVKIIDEIRHAVGPSYPIGIKINSTDKLEGGLSEKDALEFVRILDRTSVDLIDISGGTYFPGAKASSDGVVEDGPYFLEFAKIAKSATQIPLLLTGGFQRRDQAIGAITSGAVDTIGLARAMVLCPNLPREWMKESGHDPTFPLFASPPEGSITAWYTMRIAAIGEDREQDFALDAGGALQVYEERDAKRSDKWLRTFPTEASRNDPRSR